MQISVSVKNDIDCWKALETSHKSACVGSCVLPLLIVWDLKSWFDLPIIYRPFLNSHSYSRCRTSPPPVRILIVPNRRKIHAARFKFKQVQNAHPSDISLPTFIGNISLLFATMRRFSKPLYRQLYLSFFVIGLVIFILVGLLFTYFVFT